MSDKWQSIIWQMSVLGISHDIKSTSVVQVEMGIVLGALIRIYRLPKIQPKLRMRYCFWRLIAQQHESQI